MTHSTASSQQSHPSEQCSIYVSGGPTFRVLSGPGALRGRIRESGSALGDRAQEAVPAMFYADGPADSEELSAFHNGQGMVILRIGEKHFLEISPSMAKRLREQLSVAIRSALTEMLRPDSEA